MRQGSQGGHGGRLKSARSQFDSEPCHPSSRYTGLRASSFCMHCVYILKCVDGSFYTGITGDIGKRMDEHKLGLSVSTKGRLLVELVYLEEFENKYLAAKREKEIKGWRREKKLKLISSSH